MPLKARKRKGGNYQIRGTVPCRLPNGTIGTTRVEESAGTSSKREADKIAADRERYYHDLAYGNVIDKGPTFAEAVVDYLESGGGNERYLERLLDVKRADGGDFGTTPLGDIDQSLALRLVAHVCPGAKPSTQNRAVFTPLLAVARFAGVHLPVKRPKGHSRVKPKRVPDEEWFAKVIQHANPRLAAIIIFTTLTGRRIGEALNITGKDYNAKTGTVQILRTKNEHPVVVKLPAMARDILHDWRDGRAVGRDEPLFGYTTLGQVRGAIVRTCDKAGVEFYSPHVIGRHAFASRLLRQGKSLKFVQDAGGWKSMAVVAAHYGHLEQQDVQRETEAVSDEWQKGLSA